MYQKNNPLSDADYTKLNKVIDGQERVRQMIETATQALIPCEEQNQVCQEMLTKLYAMKKTYFPDRP